MAIKARAQVDVVDVTDAYGVTLTSEAHTFPGTASAAKAGSTTTQIIAMRGADQVPASVDLSKIVAPTGVTVTKDSDAVSPTLTIAVSAGVASAGIVKIPILANATATFNKEFSFAIAFIGATGGAGAPGKGISGTPAVTYQAGASGTSAPTGAWLTTIPSVGASQYLWTRTVTTYTDATTTTAYSVGLMGAQGPKGDTGGPGAPGKGISGTPVVDYQVGTSGTDVPSGTWVASPPTVAPSKYLWTRTVTRYTDATSTTAYSVGLMGSQGPKGDMGNTGAAGADALSIDITSSNGFIFKNDQIVTTFTAHVYKGAKELTASEISAQGTVKWYKDGSATAMSAGTTLSVTAGTVVDKASFEAVLDDGK